MEGQPLSNAFPFHKKQIHDTLDFLNRRHPLLKKRY